MSQDPRVQKLLSSFEKDIKAAEGRRDAALAVAEGLEKRNQLAMAGIEKEVLEQKKVLIDKAKSNLGVVKDQITKLQTVKTGLLDEIDELNTTRLDLVDSVGSLE